MLFDSYYLCKQASAIIESVPINTNTSESMGENMVCCCIWSSSFGFDDYSEMWVYGFIVLLHNSKLMRLTKVVSIPLMQILEFDDDGDS